MNERTRKPYLVNKRKLITSGRSHLREQRLRCERTATTKEVENGIEEGLRGSRVLILFYREAIN